MKRRNVLLGLAAATTVASIPLLRSQYEKKKRPDILVFLSDDQNYFSLGVRDPFYSTPNLDALSKQGYLINDSFVTTSICPVSRASIFSGQHAERNGQLGWHSPMNKNSFGHIFPFELKAAGYQIGFVGKWGVANPMPTDAFDYFDGFDDQGKYFDENFGEGHLTQNLAKSAVKAIDHFDQSDKPYMLMVSFKAPHGQKDLPFTKSPDLTLDYPEFDFSVHTSWPKNVSSFSSLPEFLKQSAGRDVYLNTLRGEKGYRNYLQAYARLICGVDKAVGDILNRATETTDMSELEVLHLSDNGMMMGEYGLFGKYLMYEDSIKIPFIWKPSKFSAHSEKLQESLVLNIDVAPTLLAAAGVKAPKDYQGIALQDLSTTVQRSDFFYSFYVTHDGRIPVCLGLRGKRYKYVEYPEYEYRQLFDLERDPEELENLVGNTKYTVELHSMKTKMETYRKQAGPQVPDHA